MFPHQSLYAELAPTIPEPWRGLLAEIATNIDQIAAQLARVSPGEAQNILARHRPTFYQALEALAVGILDFLARDPTPDQIQMTRELITTEIGRWSGASPILRHGRHEPRKPANNPELARALLETRPVGADVPSLVFNDCFRNTISGSAYRDRVAMLIEAVQRSVSDRAATGASSIRILCLHVSGASELLALAQDQTFAEIAEVTCLDTRPDALRNARSELQGWLKQPGAFIHANALRYAARPDRSSSPFDIIYGLSIFQDLDSAQAAQLARDCHTMLIPGGALFAGSVTAHVPPAERILREWLTGSKLQYRDEASWRQILTQAGFSASALHFAYEPYRANVLIRAERASEAD